MISQAAKAAGGFGCAILTLPLIAALIVALLLGGGPSGSGIPAAPSKHALADIPRRMLAIYLRAAPECRGLPWTVLAAIGKVETDHGRVHPMVSSAHAVGPMQFLEPTFKAYAHPVPPGGKKPPTPWDPVDAVHAAARLLCANGARNAAHLRRAIWHYNHDRAYVGHVLAIAAGYAAAAPATTTAARAVVFARGQIGTPYVWGGNGPTDGGFDCSGLTKAAYHAAGIALPRTAQAQYDAGPRLPAGAPPAPGDLLFFGAGPHAITHVSIYSGHGRAVDAPHPGAVVREGPANLDAPSFQGATLPSMPGGGSR